MFKLIGFLIVMIASAAGGWYLRGVYDARQDVAQAESAAWAVVDSDGAARAERQLATLSRGSVAYVALAPEDLAAHVVHSAAKGLLPSATGLRASVKDGTLGVRGIVSLKALKAGAILGTLAKVLGDTEEIQLNGTLHVVRPGLAEYRITRLRLGDVPVPSALTGAIVRNLHGAERPEGISSDGVPVEIPQYVQDIRITEGRVLVYRRVESK